MATAAARPEAPQQQSVATCQAAPQPSRDQPHTCPPWLEAPRPRSRPGPRPWPRQARGTCVPVAASVGGGAVRPARGIVGWSQSSAVGTRPAATCTRRACGRRGAANPPPAPPSDLTARPPTPRTPHPPPPPSPSTTARYSVACCCMASGGGLAGCHMVSGGCCVPATVAGWWHGRARRAQAPRDGHAARAAARVAQGRASRRTARPALQRQPLCDRPRRGAASIWPVAGLWLWLGCGWAVVGLADSAERGEQRSRRLWLPPAAYRPGRTRAPTLATRLQTAVATSCRQSSPRSVAWWRKLSVTSLLAMGSA